MFKKFLLFLAILPGMLTSLSAQNFVIVPLGVYGGGNENNLSSYLIAQKDSADFLALDAGTLRAGIEKAIRNAVFTGTEEEILRNQIKGYFISHGHLDHLAGLIINSPDDSSKPIYGIDETINTLRDRYFTNDAWVNFAGEGDEPQLKKYSYRRLKNTEKFEVTGTGLEGQIFELSHVFPHKSSALLVSDRDGNAVLYLGDTGADRIENSVNLEKLWTSIAPLYNEGKLKAIMIEVSYDNSRPDHLLFGHLTPALLNEELNNLAQIAQREDLEGLKIIVTHLKPGKENIKNIKKELQQDNPLRVEFIFPKQGESLEL